MIFKNFTCLLLVCLGSITAQTFSGKLNPSMNSAASIKVEGTFRILAVLADFQADKDAATFGTGKFGTMYSKEYGTGILDPLPHDLNYFRQHLLFAKNYYRKVSGGKVNIEFEILPQVITVAKTMRNYSPPAGSSNLDALGGFSKEVWQKADTLNNGINFGDYDIFVIFHAGVGRDLALPGSLGNERDLPSVYLGDKTLKNIFGDNLAGLPRNKSGEYNSVIVPETESREAEGLTGSALIEISINGLIVANIASHFGLPDLFDTKTGLSAIGRFGLMDGQAIFAYSGTFPPEPSPWEKINLGWAVPVETSFLNGRVNITANEVAALNDTVILKVPISASEYFLIENRQRDAKKDGAIITYYSSGNILTKTFSKDQNGFYSYAVDSLEGVVIDVDEYDWATPGNGIVIWHIDGNIINEKFASDQINTDKFKRGVDVEEADGIQDIGEKFTTIFGDEVVGEGEAADFWYGTNGSELFTDRFDDNSTPDSISNSGAYSHISLSNFSGISNKMSFNLQFGDSIVKPLFSASFNLTDIPSSFEVVPGTENHFVINNGGTLYTYNPSEGLQSFLRDAANDIAAFTWNGNDYIVTSAGVQVIGGNTQFLNFNISDFHTTPVVVYDPSGFYRIYAADNSATPRTINVYRLTDAPAVTLERTIPVGNKTISLLALADDRIAAIVTENGSSQFLIENETPVELGYLAKDMAITKNKEGKYVAIISTESGNFVVVSGGSIISKFDYYPFTPAALSAYPDYQFSVGDIKHDGENYIVILRTNTLDIKNLKGISADNFPFTLSSSAFYAAPPLIADFFNDSSPEIISTTMDGRVIAVDGRTGKMADGFPLSLGGRPFNSPVLYNNNGFLALAVLKVGGLAAWNIGPYTNTPVWFSENKDNLNSSFVPAASGVNSISTFFPRERAYNWPNPVYENSTNIRYYVSEDSRIKIKIFDLAGDYVAELNDNARGGFDNETIWNVAKIQSGVYMARIEATGTSGKSETAIIKIAVVK